MKNIEKLKEFKKLIFKYKKANGLNYVYISFILIPLTLIYFFNIYLNIKYLIIMIFISILFLFLFLKNDTKTPLKELENYNKENNELKLFFNEHILKKRKLYLIEKNFLENNDIKNLALSNNNLYLTDLTIYIENNIT